MLTVRKIMILFAACMIMTASGLSLNSEAEASVKLKKQMPELCYDCHKDLREALSDPFVHMLFKKGDCMTCHNSHVSSVAGLLDDEAGALCLGCHDKINTLISTGRLHSVFRKGSCSECHMPHSSNHADLLAEEEKALCQKCHAGTEEQGGQAYGCLPFKKGECSSCHDPHASANQNLQKTVPNTLCSECHQPRCKADGVSIVSAVKDLDCTTCHSGHGSEHAGALGPFGHSAFIKKDCGQCHVPIISGKPVTLLREGEALCFGCHKKEEYVYVKDEMHAEEQADRCTMCHSHHASDSEDLTVSELEICIECHKKTEKRTLDMERKLATDVCPPVKDRKCFECHVPGHSDMPLGFRADGIDMCARCHTSEHSSTHPVGNDIIDQRNGQPVTCISCHSMHASGYDFMLTHDRNRALCIQCHNK